MPRRRSAHQSAINNGPAEAGQMLADKPAKMEFNATAMRRLLPSINNNDNGSESMAQHANEDRSTGVHVDSKLHTIVQRMREAKEKTAATEQTIRRKSIATYCSA